MVIVAFAIVTMLAFSKWQSHQKNLELERKIARDIEIRSITDRSALDGPSPAELIANPSHPPIPQIGSLPEVPSRPTLEDSSLNEVSDQRERDQLRREIDTLKRQADLDRVNRDLQRLDDERKARRTELEHSLGLDHPQ